MHQGRPLFNLAMWFLYQFIDSYADFTWVRLLGILGTAGVALVLLQLFLREKFGVYSAFLMAAACVLTPTFGVISGWAVCIHHAPPAIGALAAGMCAFQRCKGEFLNWAAWQRLLGPAGILLLSLAYYQPSAAYFLFPAMVALRSDGRSRRVLQIATVYAATLMIYFILFKFFERLFFPEVFTAERSSLLSPADLPVRLVFLIKQPLFFLLAHWTVFWNASVEALWIRGGVMLVLGCTSLIGLFQVMRRQSRPIEAVAGLLAILGLGSAHIILPEQAYAPFRMLGLQYMILTFLCFSGGRSILLRLFPSAFPILRLPLVATVVMGLTVLSALTVTFGMAYPYAQEHKRYNEAIQRATPHVPENVRFIQGWAITRDMFFSGYGQEFNWTTTTMDYMVRPTLILTMKDLWKLEKGTPEYGQLFEMEVDIAHMEDPPTQEGWLEIDAQYLNNGLRAPASRYADVP